MKRSIVFSIILFIITIALTAAVYEIPNTSLSVDLPSSYSVSLANSLVAKKSDNSILLIIKAIEKPDQKAMLKLTNADFDKIKTEYLEKNKLKEEAIESASSFNTNFASFFEIEYEIEGISLESISYQLILENKTLEIQVMVPSGIEAKERDEIRNIVKTITASKGNGITASTNIKQNIKAFMYDDKIIDLLPRLKSKDSSYHQ